MFLTDYHLVIV